MPPPLLCIDIGNTHLHLGVAGPDGISAQAAVRTAQLDAPRDGLPTVLSALLAREPRLAGIAFCSVVPAANARLRAILAAAAPELPLFQLTCEKTLGVPVTYPTPAEIGQDRLANAVAARTLTSGPAVIIGLGTAVIFDILTARGGYEGGIIAPGPALVTRYLHERTAQLPLVEDLTTPLRGAIGKSTAEAIRIGAIIGFAGLIQALLDAVLADLADRGERDPVIFTTGGAAAIVQGRLRQTVRDVPDLTLLGLAAAWRLNQPVS